MQKRRSIKSLETAGLLLETMAQADGPIDLKVLANRADVSSSVAHGYLKSFLRLGLLNQQTTSRQYSLGPLAVKLGLSELRRLDPLDHALRVASGLRDELQQWTGVSVWGSAGPTIIRVYRSDQTLHVSGYEGAVLALETTATGRIFCAYMPRRIIAETLEDFHRGDTAAPHMGEEEFRAIVETVREQNLAIIEGVAVPGVVSISAPIFNHTGDLVCALTISGRQGCPAFRPHGDVWTALGKATAELSYRLGWRKD